MANIKVSVLNQSQSLTDDQVSQAVPALQKQVTNDFAPVWGRRRRQVCTREPTGGRFVGISDLRQL